MIGSRTILHLQRFTPAKNQCLQAFAVAIGHHKLYLLAGFEGGSIERTGPEHNAQHVKNDLLVGFSLPLYHAMRIDIALTGGGFAVLIGKPHVALAILFALHIGFRIVTWQHVALRHDAGKRVAQHEETVGFL